MQTRTVIRCILHDYRMYAMVNRLAATCSKLKPSGMATSAYIGAPLRLKVRSTKHDFESTESISWLQPLIFHLHLVALSRIDQGLIVKMSELSKRSSQIHHDPQIA